MKASSIFFIVVGTSYFLCADALYGGEKFAIEQVPYMAQVYHRLEGGLRSFESAAILSEYWLITRAAPLTRNEKLLSMQVLVKANSTTGKDGELHEIYRTFTHEKYFRGKSRNNGIALIQLADPLKFDEKCQPIPISRKTPRAGKIITVSTYGDYEKSYGWDLMQGHQIVVDHRACRRAYRKKGNFSLTLDNRVFCTNSILRVSAEEPGALAVANDTLVGLVDEGEDPLLPHVYFNLAHYYGWIEHVMKTNARVCTLKEKYPAIPSWKCI